MPSDPIEAVETFDQEALGMVPRWFPRVMLLRAEDGRAESPAHRLEMSRLSA
jgi:hypothetical protein